MRVRRGGQRWEGTDSGREKQEMEELNPIRGEGREVPEETDLQFALIGVGDLGNFLFNIYCVPVLSVQCQQLSFLAVGFPLCTNQ